MFTGLGGLLTYTSVFYKIAVFPLRVLFFKGPKFLGFGGGSSPERMCQSLTDVRSEFWSMNDDTRLECFEILENKFCSFVIGVISFFTIAILFQFSYLYINRYFLLKPLNEVNRNIERMICILNRGLLLPYRVPNDYQEYQEIRDFNKKIKSF